MRRKRRFEITMDEVTTMVCLVAKLDPAKFKYASTRSLIEKCKGILEDGDESSEFWVVKR